ncbi:MAG TPA: hypothetical protein VII56_14695 [Rhizomicrobium sp.]
MTAASTPITAQILAALCPSPNPSGPQPLPAYYGMVMLGLASQAYTAQGSDWPTIQAGLSVAITTPQYTPHLPSPVGGPDPVPGAWSLDWGPANGQDGDGDNSNLIYIASYRTPVLAGEAVGAPYFFVVGIRGTDTSVKGKPLHQQLLQDIRDFELISWPDLLAGKYNDLLHGHLCVPTPNTQDAGALTGKIALGSMRGFVKLANSTAPLNDGKIPGSKGTPLTVMAALQSLMQKNPATPIVVTGHSLGACQTQLMASYVAWQFPKTNVIPFAYAPPTAGDAGFVSTYSQQCPWGQFWYNEYDVVPYAFITMTANYEQKSGLSFAAQNLWSAYKWPDVAPGANTPVVNPNGEPGPPLPIEMVALIDTLGRLIPSVYVRPANGLLPLAGNIPSAYEIAALLAAMGGGMAKQDSTSGLAQLIWQHFPPCYSKLMAAQYGAQLAPFDFKSYKPGSVESGA